MPINELHPYWHIRSFVEKNPRITTLSLSYYTYLPQTVADNRTTLNLSATDFLNSSQITEIIEATPDGQELAIHSNVLLDNGERCHMVMVDMSTASKAHLEKLRAFLGDHFFQRIAWFNSGRSFHGYGEDLLSQQKWVQFMGLLLLANDPRLKPTVDPRWIGHRLIADFAALRWTRNTPHYLVLPSRVSARPSAPFSEVGISEKRLRKTDAADY